MSLEFKSNPSATFLWTYNYKLQFDCTQFYTSSAVISSDPLVVPVGYHQGPDYFQFVLKATGFLNTSAILLTPMLLTPSVQSGGQIIPTQKNYALWWNVTSTTSYDGQTYPLYTVGARQSASGGITRMPDVVLMQLVMNSDIRYNTVSASQASPY